MIALLSCSTSLYANDNGISSTGGREQRSDSVLISYDDLRTVNSKLVQLDYEIEANKKLKSIIANDNIIITDYRINNEKLSRDCKKAIRQRNVAIGCGIAGILIGTLLIFVK